MFMYFYLLMIAGAFGNLVAGTLTDTKIPFGIIALTALGMLAGQMIYRWRVDIMPNLYAQEIDADQRIKA